MKTVAQIAKDFGVSKQAVYVWISEGLPYKKEKVIGRQTRIIIDPIDVEIFHRNKTTKEKDVSGVK